MNDPQKAIDVGITVFFAVFVALMVYALASCVAVTPPQHIRDTAILHPRIMVKPIVKHGPFIWIDVDLYNPTMQPIIADVTCQYHQDDWHDWQSDASRTIKVPAGSKRTWKLQYVPNIMQRVKLSVECDANWRRER